LLFLFLPLLWPGYYQYQFNVWIVPLAFLGVGFILFKLDIMGAGDSKYLFSLFLLIPQNLHEELLIRLLFITVCVGGSLLGWKMLTRWQEFKHALITRGARMRTLIGGKFTYAPVILGAWVWFLLQIGIRH
jgi:prepilin peptidase CpaA